MGIKPPPMTYAPPRPPTKNETIDDEGDALPWYTRAWWDLLNLLDDLGLNVFEEPLEDDTRR